MACTMPLPELTPPSQTPPPDSNNNNGSGNNTGQSQVVPLDQVFARTGLYNDQTIRYLDLNTCKPGEACINRLNTPLSPLLRYEFFFSDNTPVVGQNPVFNTPREDELDTPFRQVIRVIVPDGYIANTIRSSQSVAESQFRTEPTNRVLNNPMISNESQARLPLTIGRAWLQNQTSAYLDLGTVPYNPSLNRLGTGVVYFMRNQDKTDLPSQPAPIFDSVPGELLYSPIRQVFRAVAEDQADNLNADASRDIRSQEQLLNAVRNGQFRLEITQDFFNYPVYQLDQLTPTTVYNLSLAQAGNFPALPAGANYSLWMIDQLNQARLLLRFRGEASILRELGANQNLTIGSGAPSLFSFSQSEVESFRHFLVTIETGEVTQPTGGTMLEARYEAREETELSVPFADTYRSLQPGNFILTAPTTPDINLQGSGIWFVQRRDLNTNNPPLNSNLDPGLVLGLPPRGWSYNGWILTELRNPVWVPTGRFQASNQPDREQRFSTSERQPFRYPGEDFLINPPPGVIFPMDLNSTGEREVVVSLEPDQLTLSRPFFPLYRANLPKAMPEQTNQTLPVNNVTYPTLRLRLQRQSN